MAKDTKLKKVRSEVSASIPQTRGNLEFNICNVPYTVTTEQCKDYLQNKLNVIVNAMRSNGQYSGADISINLISFNAAEGFAPFCVMLPNLVMKQRSRKSGDDLGILMPDNDNDNIVGNMLDPIWRLFSPYMYNKDDASAFFTSVFREMGVRRYTASELARYRMPFSVTVDNNGNKLIAFLVDPLRLFHDMLKWENHPAANRTFKVRVDRISHMMGSNYRYDITRCLFNNSKQQVDNGTLEAAIKFNGKG